MIEPKDLSPVNRARTIGRGAYLLLLYIALITALAVVSTVGWVKQTRQVRDLQDQFEQAKLCGLEVVQCRGEK